MEPDSLMNNIMLPILNDHIKELAALHYQNHVLATKLHTAREALRKLYFLQDEIDKVLLETRYDTQALLQEIS